MSDGARHGEGRRTTDGPAMAEENAKLRKLVEGLQLQLRLEQAIRRKQADEITKLRRITKPQIEFDEN